MSNDRKTGDLRREAKRSVFVGVKRALEDIHEEWIGAGMAMERSKMIDFRNEAAKRIWGIVAVHLPEGRAERGFRQIEHSAMALIGDFVELHLRKARDVYAESVGDSEEMLARLAKSNSRMSVSNPHNSIIRLIEMTRGLEPCTEIEEPSLKMAA